MPRIDSNDVEVKQGKPRILKPTGDAKDALEPDLVEPADRVVNKDWADMMAFNEEVIEVMVHESTDKNAEAIVEVFNNGIPQRFIRGQKQMVKRKFVEVLAKAKPTNYTQRAESDRDFTEGGAFVPHTAIRYPFSVTNDPNPRGADWLRSILQQQA